MLSFRQNKEGIYLNTNNRRINYGSYIDTRNKKNILHYGERQHHIIRHFEKVLISLIKKLKRKNINILDIGCGDALLVKSIANINKKIQSKIFYVGLDIDPHLKKYFKDTKYQRFIISSSTKISLPDNSVDIVISSQHLEHLFLKEINLTLKEVRRVMAYESYFYIETPNPESLLYRLMKDQWYQILAEHLTFIPPKPGIKLLTKNGFRNIKGYSRYEVDSQFNEAWEILMHINNSLLKFIPWKIKIPLILFYLMLTNSAQITVLQAQK